MHQKPRQLESLGGLAEDTRHNIDPVCHPVESTDDRYGLGGVAQNLIEG